MAPYAVRNSLPFQARHNLGYPQWPPSPLYRGHRSLYSKSGTLVKIGTSLARFHILSMFPAGDFVIRVTKPWPQPLFSKFNAAVFLSHLIPH